MFFCMNNPTDIVQIWFRSNFFFKDSLEWNHFYNILSDIKRVDKTKLIYLAMLSLETLLKAIILLKLPISSTDEKIQKTLKSLNHNLFDLYLKINWDSLNEDQVNLLKQRDKYGVSIRYSTDAFFMWLEVKWVQSNKKTREREERKKEIEKQLMIYNSLYQNLLFFYRESLKNLDVTNWTAFFDNLINEKCSLWVATGHHCRYKDNYY